MPPAALRCGPNPSGYMQPAAPLQPSAAKRLARDLRQLSRESLPTVAAAPLGDDLARWHFSLTCAEGPYLGCIFHGVLDFPSDYPTNPPVCKLCTGIPHPNVFSGYDYNQHQVRGHARPPASATSKASTDGL